MPWQTTLAAMHEKALHQWTDNKDSESLLIRFVADLLGHSTSKITEVYYVKKDATRPAGITAGFEL